MTKKEIHFELESLLDKTVDHKVVVKTPNIKTILDDLRVFIGYLLFDRDCLKRECKALRKKRE